MSTRRNFIGTSGLTVTGLTIAGTGKLMANPSNGLSFVTKRPTPEKRKFTSEVIEKTIQLSSWQNRYNRLLQLPLMKMPSVQIKTGQTEIWPTV